MKFLKLASGVITEAVEGIGHRGTTLVSASQSITASLFGGYIYCSSGTAITLTLDTLANTVQGDTISIYNGGAGVVTIAAAGTNPNTINADGVSAASSISIAQYESMILVRLTTTWGEVAASKLSAGGSATWPVTNTNGGSGPTQIAIGQFAQNTAPGTNTVAIGTSAANNTQGSNAVALGYSSGSQNQGGSAVAIGTLSGYYNQGSSAVSIGNSAGMGTGASSAFTSTTGTTLVVADTSQILVGSTVSGVGFSSGQTVVSKSATDTVTLTISAAADSTPSGNINFRKGQGTQSVAIGNSAGQNNQGTLAISIGQSTGQSNQGTVSIALGNNAANNYQGSNAIALGGSTAQSNQGNNSIAIGAQAAQGSITTVAYTSHTGTTLVVATTQNISLGAVITGIGFYNGQIVTSKSIDGITLAVSAAPSTTPSGSLTFYNGQSTGAIALGVNAGNTYQGQSAVAIGPSAGNSKQSTNTVAIGLLSGQNGQGFSGVAVGSNAGQHYQGQYSIAVGIQAGQGVAAVAAYVSHTGTTLVVSNTANILVGSTISNAGYHSGQTVIGKSTDGITLTTSAAPTHTPSGSMTFYKAQGTSSIAIGAYCASINQGDSSVAIGPNTATNNQGGNSVAIGNNTAITAQGTTAVAIGHQASTYNQGNYAISIGTNAGGSVTGFVTYVSHIGTALTVSSIVNIVVGSIISANGYNSGQTVTAITSATTVTTSAPPETTPSGTITLYKGQGISAVALGHNAGQTNQGTLSIAIGATAGANYQGTYSIAMGVFAASVNQGSQGIAIGYTAGQGRNTQATYTSTTGTTLVVSSTVGIDVGATISGVGFYGGQTVVSITNATDLVMSAAATSTPSGTITFTKGQADTAIAIGSSAGRYNQGSNSIALGTGAGTNSQGTLSVSLGTNSGTNSQGIQAVALGYSAGQNNQGANSIAIGCQAGITSQAANTIILNASGNVLNGVDAQINSLYIDPIRSATSSVNVLSYNTTTKEVTYGSVAGIDASAITTGTIDAARLPAYVDDVLEYANLAAFPVTGTAGIIYVAIDTNKTYRWSGTVYIYITSGAVDSVGGNTGVVTAVQLLAAIQTQITLTGSNTGDNAVNSLYSGLVSNATHTGEVTGDTALTIATNAVTNAKLAQVATATFKGRITAATGNVEDLSTTQATSMLDVFSSTLKGLAPASGGGTTNFLRADGTWAAAGGGAGSWPVTNTTGASGPTVIGIGLNAQATSPGTNTIAIGASAGNSTQGNTSIAIGAGAGQTNQGISAIAIGSSTATTNQASGAIAIGSNSAPNTQGAYSIVLGYQAGGGASGPDGNAIAIGRQAGYNGQGLETIALGYSAGVTLQGARSIAIGANAGYNNMGNYSIAIGYSAGREAQPTKTIILNATNEAEGLSGIPAQQDSFYINPIREGKFQHDNILSWNPMTKEITQGNSLARLGSAKIGMWNPHGNATTLPGVFGLTAPTAIGTTTARNVATTNTFTRCRRIGYVSANTAGQACGQFSTSAQYTMADTVGNGGFYYGITFGCSDAVAVATGITFVGFSNLIVSPTVTTSPATLTNCIGIGCATADTNYSIYYGGSAAQTPIALGAGFPAKTASLDLIEFILFNPIYDLLNVHYQVTNIGKGAAFSCTITGTTMTTSALTRGTIRIGQKVIGRDIIPNTYITAGSGTSWTVSQSYVLYPALTGTPLPVIAEIVVEGVLTAAISGTQLPLSTTFLAPRAYRSNNATASAVGIDISTIYLETEQ